jgi:hypothetical protein
MNSALTYREQRPNWSDLLGPEDLFELGLSLLECLDSLLPLFRV